MATIDQDIRTEIRRASDRVRTLRDETRLKIHLASMDARDAWDRLQPKLEEAERSAEQATKDALQSIESTAKKLEDLLAAL